LAKTSKPKMELPVTKSPFPKENVHQLFKEKTIFGESFVTLEISVKSGKDSTSTLSLVIHRARLKKKTCEKVH